ncbi:MAG: hypothetical protein AAFV45_15070 [Pseudomonadota bacterium]
MSKPQPHPFKPVNEDLPDLDDNLVNALVNVQQGTITSEPDAEEYTPEELAEAEAARKKASPAEKAKAAAEQPTPFEDYEAMNLRLPNYLMDQLRDAAHTKRSTVRFEILRGLRRAGFKIKDADMIKDARKGRKKRSKSGK